MSKPDLNESQVNPDEMFDFLDEEAANRSARSPQSRRRKQFEMPIIRKPVPIAQSGPINVDSGAQVKDLDNLNKAGSPKKPAPARVAADTQDFENFDVSERQTPKLKRFAFLLIFAIASAAFGYKVLMQPDPAPIVSNGDDQLVPAATTAPDSSGDLPTVAEPTTDPVAQSNTLFNQFNEQLQLLESLLADGKVDEADQVISGMDRAVYGYGVGEFTDIEKRIKQQRAAVTPANSGNETTAEATTETEQVQTETAEAEKAAAEAEAIANLSPEEQRRLAAQQLAEEQRLVEAQRILDEATATEQAQLADEARAAEEARRAENERLAAEARAAEEARQAEEQRVAEQARLAAEERAAQSAQKLIEQARLDEQARLEDEAQKAEQARLDEAVRLAEQAQLTEQARIAERARLAEQSRLAEQARLAEAERLAAQTQSEQTAQLEQAAIDSLALATAKAEERISEQNARLDRERAEVAEAARARALTQAQESERIRAEEAQVNRQPTAAATPLSISITDADFNLVAGKFVELKNAVTGRDINSVIALTKPSGKRIQQMLQIFENSSSIQARVSNVATREADGVIIGELKIQKLIKSSGAEATVPSNLSSITLTSKRGPDGWSVIAW